MNEPTLIQRIEAYLGDDNSPHITLSVSLVLLREALAALKEKPESKVYGIRDGMCMACMGTGQMPAAIERDLER